MERRRKPTAHNRSRKVNHKVETSRSAVVNLSLPNIAELINHGDITIGALRPVGCVATAADEDCTYAMLVRRRGETLEQLLVRLDQAIYKALAEDIFTDEINAP